MSTYEMSLFQTISSDMFPLTITYLQTHTHTHTNTQCVYDTIAELEQT